MGVSVPADARPQWPFQPVSTQTPARGSKKQCSRRCKYSTHHHNPETLPLFCHSPSPERHQSAAGCRGAWPAAAPAAVSRFNPLGCAWSKGHIKRAAPTLHATYSSSTAWSCTDGGARAIVAFSETPAAGIGTILADLIIMICRPCQITLADQHQITLARHTSLQVLWGTAER